jgi:hypothetical protein
MAIPILNANASTVAEDLPGGLEHAARSQTARKVIVSVERGGEKIAHLWVDLTGVSKVERQARGAVLGHSC